MVCPRREPGPSNSRRTRRPRTSYKSSVARRAARRHWTPGTLGVADYTDTVGTTGSSTPTPAPIVNAGDWSQVWMPFFA